MDNASLKGYFKPHIRSSLKAELKSSKLIRVVQERT